MLNYGGWQADLIKNNAGFIIPNNDPIQASVIIESYINDKDKINVMSNESKGYQKISVFKQILRN